MIVEVEAKSLSVDNFLKETVIAVGDQLLRLQRFMAPAYDLLVKIKLDGSEVTYADECGQKAIIEVLKIVDILEEKNRLVFAEENGLHKIQPTSNCWFLDPLDGTFRYARSLDGWGIMLSEYSDGEVVRVFVYCPGINSQLLEYVKGGQLLVNGLPLQPLPEDTPCVLLMSERSRIALEEQYPDLNAKIQNLRGQGKLTVKDSKSAASSLFAICNQGCSYLSVGTAVWEVSALRALEAADGFVHDLNGQPHNFASDFRQPVFATIDFDLRQALFR